MRRFAYPTSQHLEQRWYACVLCDDGTSLLYPESMIVEYAGEKYCREHYAAKIVKKILLDYTPEMTDDV
jgi:hypothetical protein